MIRTELSWIALDLNKILAALSSSDERKTAREGPKKRKKTSALADFRFHTDTVFEERWDKNQVHVIGYVHPP